MSQTQLGSADGYGSHHKTIAYRHRTTSCVQPPRHTGQGQFNLGQDSTEGTNTTREGKCIKQKETKEEETFMGSPAEY
eukprot:11686554-Ditylum_brightwellii.AAC.1